MIARLRKRKKINTHFVEPDEIFLDAKNLPEFDTHQFEGRLSHPISKRTIMVLAIVFVAFGLIGLGRLAILQIKKGAMYYQKSVDNSLVEQPLFAERGVIYDRNGLQLVKNIIPDGSNPNTVPIRQYDTDPGFGLLLGYVGYPKQDSSGNYWQENIVGKSGVEQEFNDVLSGTNGSTLYERDAAGNVLSQNQINAPQNGKNVTLSIDAGVQTQMYQAIESFAKTHDYVGGAGLIMDVHTGQLIALTSYPEFDPTVLSQGNDSATIDSYLHDPANPFLNRAIAGLYAPGSIVKPYEALAALENNIITPEKQILSTGQIELPNPYDPSKETIFKDNAAHGWVDMDAALAVSSNVYFYEIGGGYQSQPGLGITKLHDALTNFDIGSKTGIDLGGEVSGTVPDPAWKATHFPTDPTWRVGDTYHTAIGQYGTQVTPIQMLRGVAAIANGGTLLTPSIINGTVSPQDDKVAIDPADLEVVKEGMRECVTSGTGISLNVPEVQIAVKSGTAQVGISKNSIDSWSMGFFPYQNPEYAFVVMIDGGPKANEVGASNVMRQVVNWMNTNEPDYFGSIAPVSTASN